MDFILFQVRTLPRIRSSPKHFKRRTPRGPQNGFLKKILPGMLHPALGPPKQEIHDPAGVSPKQATEMIES